MLLRVQETRARSPTGKVEGLIWKIPGKESLQAVSKIQSSTQSFEYGCEVGAMIEAFTTAIDSGTSQGTDAAIGDMTTVTGDRWRLLALGSLWLVLGTLSGATAVTAPPAILAVVGAVSLIGAAVALRGALEANRDVTVFALGLPGSLQPVAAILLLVYGLTSAPGSALMLAALFLAEGLMRIGLALHVRFPAREWQFAHGFLALSLAIAVLSQWPQPSLRVLQLSLGIDMAFAGWWCLILAAVFRRSTVSPRGSPEVGH